MQTEHRYHLPKRPYSPIDALNRRAAALGSVGYAQKAAHANYNGHHVTVTWNSYRGYYVAEYYWAERVVLARGTAEACISAAVREYDKGALGASVDVALLEGDVERVVPLYPALLPGKLSLKADWHTWRHECAEAAARDAASPRLSVMVFDWPLLQAASDRADYERALKAKYGRSYT